VTELKIDDSQPATFKAEFEILPLVDLPDYKGLPVKSREATVAEADVDKEIDRLREEAARYDPVEGRPAREGDHVVLDVQFTKEDGTRGKRDENVSSKSAPRTTTRTSTPPSSASPPGTRRTSRSSTARITSRRACAARPWPTTSP
jgi:hypothetical protein